VVFRLNHSTSQLLNNLLGVRLCLGEADDFAAVFPLAALLQKLDPLETLQDVAFSDDRAGSFKAAMLRHKSEMSAQTSAKLALFKRRLAENYNWFVRTTCAPEVAT